ncbi:FG-GAP repeat domain-containing protein [Nannocystis radixulma]|uniref:VCBS repeat-containing protein n=1 Tax=Nannocystis radixulma TaxID=2995305 RepID=A0ABT5B3I4_9BACT|nr:VCBS repeat-containing protein [Nannocystis radixulma]MDC0668298.1 VCBS repeat-containing protein [Nannocystis radixulma]
MVRAAVEVDVDGDGQTEVFALTGESRQLAFGRRDGRRSMVSFAEPPMSLAALHGEVAVSLAEPPMVAIYGIDGEGRLERRREIPLSGRAPALASGDLDGDGKLELVASVFDNGRVAVIDPRTGAVREHRAGKASSWLALGDIDGDSRLDVVVADAGEALQVLRGAGDGTLRKAEASPANVETYALTLADYDGDGDLDALTRDMASNVRVHRNDGEGRFASPIALPFGEHPASGFGLVAGPIANGGLAGVSVPLDDGLGTWFGKGATWLGHVEVAFDRAVTWVGGDADGGFLAGGEGFVMPFAWAAGVTPIEVWSSPILSGESSDSALATGDLDGDHLLDVVAATSGEVVVLHGRADLGLEPWAGFGFEGARSVAIAEMTGDEWPDALFAGEQSVSMAVGSAWGLFPLWPVASTTIKPTELTPLRTAAGTAGVAIATAAVEVATEGEYSPAALLRFDDTGRLLEERVFGEELGVGRVIAVDFDEDGVDEPLLLAERDGMPVLVHAVPDGDGYALGVEHDVAAISDLLPEEIWLERLTAGDLDGDGTPELVLAANAGALVVSGMADDAPTATVLAEIWAPSHLHDLDGDGRLDAIFAARGYFVYQRGRGDGTFEARQTYEFPHYDLAALAARTDAQFDLVTLGSGGLGVHLAREVARPVAVDDPLNFHGDVAEVAAADIDQDGYDDLVTLCRQASGGVAVLWGSEDAALDRADGFGSRGEHSGLGLGDLDGDGFAEVVAALHGWYVEPYRFAPERVAEWANLDLLNSLQKAEDLAIADVDDDGLPDILALAAVDVTDWKKMNLYVAYGTEPLQFTPWHDVVEVPELTRSALAVGDVDGDDDLDLLIRPASEMPGLLLRNTGPREWAEAETMPGTTALFGPPDADGRVDLITHEGTTVYRHIDGDPERREVLLTHELLTEGALRQVGDADGDGRYDLVTFDEWGTSVWLRGDDGSMQVRVAEDKLAAVQFPDIDGDGRPDLVGLNSRGKLFVRHTRR